MQIAHGVDLEDVGEDWHHCHVGDEAEHVVFEVCKTVEWSHQDGQNVATEHYDGGHTEQTEVSITAGNRLERAEVITVAYLLLLSWVEASIDGHIVNDTCN